MKEDYNIKDPKVDDLINRLRFKLPEYDTISNYKRLQERINTPVISLSKNISPAWKWFSIAASFALLVVSAFHFIDLSRPELVWYEVAAVPDAKTKIVLPDSSTVWLNANARLVYPRSFEDVNRKVSISGEAFFQVRKDKNHPFIVDIGKLQIEVLGTSFNVSVYEDEETVHTTLVKGSVEVQPVQQEAIMLKPGEQACLAGNRMTVKAVNTRQFTSWIDGKFMFCNTALEEISKQISRWYDVDIFFSSEQVKTICFTGAILRFEPLEELIRMIENTSNVRFSVKGKTIVISEQK